MTAHNNSSPPAGSLETDPRFPSGPWVGFFTQPILPGKHSMELRLSFHQGVMTGDGRDWVGPFTIQGRYDLSNGKCHWHKKYLSKHDVHYTGFNEGKGIWGTWEIPPNQNGGLHWTGGFYIWPEGWPDPTMEHLYEEADPPIVVKEQESEQLMPARSW
jgi:hypothetical protein